jgi:outer membrane protein OmpA-like peptidoglycan-associated protein
VIDFLLHFFHIEQNSIKEGNMNPRISRSIALASALFTLVFFLGCAGMEFAPRNGIMFYPKELTGADKAVCNAQQAGKDKQCPKEFTEAKNLNDKAFETYRSCRTKEALEMAKEATSKANALCFAPPPPPPTPPAPKVEPKVIDKMTLQLHFDFNKAAIKDVDISELKKAVNFIKKYPRANVKLEGHTDSIGTDKYNQSLSERRAEAVKKYLVKEGASQASRISTIGYGKSKPVDTNKTKAGRAKNRRVEVLILSE